ncbi:golgin subfamily A member 3-like isoform X2 [Periplaneta americana]
MKTINDSRSSLLSNKISDEMEPHKLMKYPPDRITVVTEKCPSLTKSSSNLKKPDTCYRQTIEQYGILSSAPKSSLSAASSYESIATANIVPERFCHKSSALSSHSVSNVVSESDCKLDRITTTANQLAWEFRRARDRLDTASNISGCSSNLELESERAETMSTISDVSGYEEEMYRIKRFLLLDSSATPPPFSGKLEKMKDMNVTLTLPKSDSLTTTKENVEIQIYRLSVQLQNALAEKEKYRIAALAAETKVALEWEEKYQEALRQKAHMEGQLETVQSEMTTLVSEQKEVLEHAKILEKDFMLKTAAEGKAALQEIEKYVSEINQLHQVIREVESRNQDLMTQLELIGSQLSQCKKEVRVTDNSNEKLRIEMQELKIETESRDGAIQGLKSKISDQHVELQSLLQAKLKAENNQTSLKNEIETIKKSNNWYRDQLHICQAAKVKVQQEFMASQTEVVSQSHQIDKLKGEIANLRQLVNETQHRAVREKETLMRKLKAIQADMLEREAAILGHISNESTADTISTITTKLKRIEEEKTQMMSLSDTVVQELKEEIVSLKNELHIKEMSLDGSVNENAQLIVRITTLQKTLNEKKLALQLLENKYKDIEMSYSHLEENLRQKEQMLLELKNEKVAIEVALTAAVKEKMEVDTVIAELRDDFARITTSYKTMKAEIVDKDKHIISLESNINEIQGEVQKQTEKVIVLETIQKQYNELQQRISEIEVQEQQIEQLLKANKEITLKFNELNEAYNYTKDQMMKMEETIAVREEQLMNQTHNFEVHSEEMKAKEQLLIKLESEKKSFEGHVETLQIKMRELKVSNEKLSHEVNSLKKQLSNANGVIEQFNVLCRKSEEEKSLLEKQTKTLLRKLHSVETLHTVAINGNVIESMPNLQKPIPMHENGCVQNNFHKFCMLIQSTESKLLSLLSEEHRNQERKFQEEQVNTVVNNNVIEFDTLFSIIVNISDYLTKALECRNELQTEFQREKESNEVLRNELLDLKNRIKIEPSSQNKDQTASHSTQTDKITVEDSETQTMNDIFNYKDQVELLQKEINRLKGSLKISEIEHRDKHRKYESNIRTLLKKVKEHMRGRKVAESALEELSGKTDKHDDLSSLRNEICKLQSELEASEKKCMEQKKIAERNQEAVLELEKERGKLAQSQCLSKEKLPAVPQILDRDTAVCTEFDHKARELQLHQNLTRITELEEEVRKSHIIIKELRKEIFSEKCETSQLKKQLSSLRMGLDTANDMLDTKNIELGRAESLCCVLRTNISHLKKQLEMEQEAHEECKREVEKLAENLEEAKAKDPMLADQIKTLSYHLHQKSQEATALQEKICLSEERWKITENGLQNNLSALQNEHTALLAEMDSVRSDKFTLQAQAAELRAALNSSMEQNKVLRLKLEAYGCENKERLPDLTSSLPLPPSKYDETRIAELLHRSTVLPHNKPLNNLQCCLDSLKQEMETLQKQLVAKTSSRSVTDLKKENKSGVKDV